MNYITAHYCTCTYFWIIFLPVGPVGSVDLGHVCTATVEILVKYHWICHTVSTSASQPTTDSIPKDENVFVRYVCSYVCTHYTITLNYHTNNLYSASIALIRLFSVTMYFVTKAMPINRIALLRLKM